MFSLDNALKSVSTDLIKKPWKKIWPPENLQEDEENESEDDIPLAQLTKKISEAEDVLEIKNSMQEIVNLVKNFDESLSNDEIEEWVVGRGEACGETLTDDEIIQVADNDADSEISDEQEEPVDLIKHGVAVSAFKTCLNGLHRIMWKTIESFYSKNFEITLLILK